MEQGGSRGLSCLASSGRAFEGYTSVLFCSATASMTCAGMSPSHARCPFTISHSSTPKAYTSAACACANLRPDGLCMAFDSQPYGTLRGLAGEQRNIKARKALLLLLDPHDAKISHRQIDNVHPPVVADKRGVC